MQTAITKQISALTLGLMLFLAAQADAQSSNSADDETGHTHAAAEHHHTDEIAKGYFDDSQIVPRTLADWEGDWQSVYPLLQDGTLDPVMEEKAAHGDKSAEEYRAYYTTGYQTTVDRIVISGDSITFYEKDQSAEATYAPDGHEVLTYEKGNRGVRFIFSKVAGDENAPAVIQFSDHRIAPDPADHYHLYWGDDRVALLNELTNWPTYFPAALSGEEVVAEMLAH